MAQRQSFWIGCGLLFAVFLWSTEYVGVRQAIHDFSPGALALSRYLLTSLFMLVVYFLLPERTPIRLRDIPGIFLLGALGIAGYTMGLNYGEQSVSSGTSSFVVSQMPIIMALLGFLFLREPVRWFMIAGMILGGIGMLIISYDGLHIAHFELGLFCIMMGTFGACIYSVLQKPFLSRYNAIEFTAFMVWSATIVMLVYLPNVEVELPKASFSAIGALIYLAIFPAAIAYFIWGYAIARFPVAKAGSYLYLSPLMATALGWWYLGEVPRPLAIVGGVVALAGAVLVNADQYFAWSKSRVYER